jgi:hypothetical protein
MAHLGIQKSTVFRCASRNIIQAKVAVGSYGTLVSVKLWLQQMTQHVFYTNAGPEIHSTRWKAQFWSCSPILHPKYSSGITVLFEVLRVN